MKPIVVYGGSFDPIHNGHIRIAKAASRILGAEVIFLPAASPRWKAPSATVSQRLEMIKGSLEAIKDECFSIDLYEINSKADVNYSIDSAKYFSKKYNGRVIYWLIGGDSVNTFPSWKDAKELSSIVKIVYVPRPDVTVKEEIVKEYGMAELDYLESGEVSSRAIRQMASTDIPYFVRNYIEDNKLYYAKALLEAVGNHRYQHSVRVARLCYAIALNNHLDNPSRAYVAGFLHDFGKHTDIEEARSIIKTNYKEYLFLPQWAYHQFVGAYIAENEIGIKDKEIIEAIEFHATAKPNMTTLGMIVYSADKIEPGRKFDSSDLIKSCLRDYKKGFVDVLIANVEFGKSQSREAETELTLGCVKQYVGGTN